MFYNRLSSSLILPEGQGDLKVGLDLRGLFHPQRFYGSMRCQKKKEEDHDCLFKNVRGEWLPVTFLLQKREAEKGNSPSVREIYHLTVRFYPGLLISFFRDRKDMPENPKMS